MALLDGRRAANGPIAWLAGLTRLALCLGLLSTGPLPARAGPVLDRVRAQALVRVCIWPDYHGITLRDPQSEQLRGIDIDLSAAFARSLGVRLAYVNSSFQTLVKDLQTDRCDVSMHGVGVTPERAQALAFSRPYLKSDIYALTSLNSRVVRTWQDIDRPGVRVAVQAGTLMEPVMRAALQRADLVVVRAPATREGELEAGRVDVFMSDYPFSRRLLDTVDWLRLIQPDTPFHETPYAYAVKQGDGAWLQALDRFVATVQADGRLKAAALRHGLGAIVVLP
jgi:ABC-type amino acid transport substrate-binding protein